MSISKKKQQEIRNIGFHIFNTILDTHFDDHNIGGTKWYDTPPEMWMPEEKKIYDALTDFQTQFEEQVIKMFNNEKTKTST
jgi:hypothetical protein